MSGFGIPSVSISSPRGNLYYPPMPRPLPVVQIRSPTQLFPSLISEERERVQKRVDGFNWKRSTAWKRLTSSYGPNLKHEELLSIGDLVAKKLDIRLDRDARRRKIVMIKWFEENWAAVEPLLSKIILEDE
jgi:hypothetical protein